MAEIFIHEWNKSDYDGRRILSSKSAEKIGGEHAYACQNLTSWFRLGKYIIKHDQANFLLGLIREIGTDNVKSWERDEQEDRWMCKYHVDDIVRVVNRHFSGNDYVLTLLMLQEELKGYENCYFICACYRLDFDYVQFIKDKDVYQARLMTFAKKANEEKKEDWRMGEELIPAGLGKLYIAPAGDMNPEHLQSIKLHSVAIDLGDGENHASESTWGNNVGKGYCITGTLKLENNKEMRKNLQKLMRGEGRLPRKEKKRMRNSILRNKRALIFVLIATMIGYGTAFNDAAAFMFAGRPRTTDGEGHALMQLNNAEWHAVDTLVRHLYKHRSTMLKRLWQRNRDLFPEV